MAVVFSEVTGDISPDFMKCFENNFFREKLDLICKDDKVKPVRLREIFPPSNSSSLASDSANSGKCGTLRVHGNLDAILHVHERLMELFNVNEDLTKKTISSNEIEQSTDSDRRSLRLSHSQRVEKHTKSLSQIIDNIAEQKQNFTTSDCDTNIDLHCSTSTSTASSETQSPIGDHNSTKEQSLQPSRDASTRAKSSATDSHLTIVQPPTPMSHSAVIKKNKSKRCRKQARPYNLRKSINQSSKLTFLKLKKTESDLKSSVLSCHGRSTNNNSKTFTKTKNNVVTRQRGKSKLLLCDLCDFKCLETPQLNEHCIEKHSNNCQKKDNIHQKEDLITSVIKVPKLTKKTSKKNSFIADVVHCEKCDFKTNSQTNLKQHLQRIHIGIASKEYPCSMCDKIFGYSKGLKRHMKSHERKLEKLRNMPTEFKCEYCKYSSKKSLHLKEHMRRKHMDVTNQKFQCDECGKSFGYVKGLKRHQKTHEVRRQLKLDRKNEPVSLDCAHCEYRAKKKSHLFEHMRRNHMDITNTSFPCTKCGKLYGFRKDLNRHMKIHEEPSIVCEECGNLYKSMTALKYHMKTHDENSVHIRYHCKMCPRSFKQKGTLNLHFKNIHLGIRDCFLCQTCDKSFCRKASYIAHMNVHLGKKPHVCEICGKAFSYVKSIIEHRRTHSEVRAFQCNICLKTFRLSSALYKHKQIHVEGKHACTICYKKFRDKSSLSIHEKIHSGIKPYSCKLCTKALLDRPHIQKHLVTVHQLPPENWKKYVKSEFTKPTKRFIEPVNSDALKNVYLSIAHPKKVRLSGLSEPSVPLPITPGDNTETFSEIVENAAIINSDTSDCPKLSVEAAEVTEEIYTVPNIPSPETAVQCSISEETSFPMNNSTSSLLHHTSCESNNSNMEEMSHKETVMKYNKQNCAEEEVALPTVDSLPETLVQTPQPINMNVTENFVYVDQKAEPIASSKHTDLQTTTSTYIIKDLNSGVQADDFSTPELVEESVMAANIIQDGQSVSFVSGAETFDRGQENETIVESEQFIYATENGEQFSQIIIVEEVDGQVIYTMSQ